MAASSDRVPEPLLRQAMPELDAVRGVAVGAVLVYHTLFWSVWSESLSGVARTIVGATAGGWLGVQLFFVLSGFLITGILVDTRARPDYFSRFYRRRALRILPAYLALLGVLFAARAVGTPFLLVSALFVANLASLFGVPIQYGPLWSLAVEEQFYLVWPLVARRLRPAALAGIAAAIVLLTPVARLAAFQRWGPGPLYGQTWFVADGLALGALVSIYLRSPKASRRNARRLAAMLILIGGGSIAAGIPFGILHRTNPLGAALQLAPWHFLFAGGIVLTLVIGTSPRRHLVLSMPLRYLGRISYGLYLVHVFVIGAFDAAMARWLPGLVAWERGTVAGLTVRMVVVGAAAIGIATLSREYFEELFLRRKERFSASGRPPATQPDVPELVVPVPESAA